MPGRVTCACTARRRRRSTRATWRWPAASARRSPSAATCSCGVGPPSGLMGEVARAARAAGGRTVGVIPEALRAIEIADHAADELVVTAGHAHPQGRAGRAAPTPSSRSPAASARSRSSSSSSPDGLLGFHDKPIVLVDVGGFWQPLLELFEHLYRERFARPESRAPTRWRATSTACWPRSTLPWPTAPEQVAVRARSAAVAGRPTSAVPDRRPARTTPPSPRGR